MGKKKKKKQKVQKKKKKKQKVQKKKKKGKKKKKKKKRVQKKKIFLLYFKKSNQDQKKKEQLLNDWSKLAQQLNDDKNNKEQNEYSLKFFMNKMKELNQKKYEKKVEIIQKVYQKFIKNQSSLSLNINLNINLNSEFSKNLLYFLENSELQAKKLILLNYCSNNVETLLRYDFNKTFIQKNTKVYIHQLINEEGISGQPIQLLKDNITNTIFANPWEVNIQLSIFIIIPNTEESLYNNVDFVKWIYQNNTDFKPNITANLSYKSVINLLNEAPPKYWQDDRKNDENHGIINKLSTYINEYDKNYITHL